jgi:uncharacterized protein (DUF427 family)
MAGTVSSVKTAAHEAPQASEDSTYAVSIEPCRKRVRAVFSGNTIADTVDSMLLLETGHAPVYYFPRRDVRMDLLERSGHCTRCPYKGEASYWTLAVGGRSEANAVWGYERPLPRAARIGGLLAFYWDKIDHWLEEDEEIFGHPHDPYHGIDVRASTRVVRVIFGGEEVAFTDRGLFVFETGLPPRYYIPQRDVRAAFLQESQHSTVCAYKGRASYWSLRVRGKFSENAVWSYREPNLEYLRIANYLCFYPEKVDKIEVEG